MKKSAITHPSVVYSLRMPKNAFRFWKIVQAFCILLIYGMRFLLILTWVSAVEAKPVKLGFRDKKFGLKPNKINVCKCSLVQLYDAICTIFQVLDKLEIDQKVCWVCRLACGFNFTVFCLLNPFTAGVALMRHRK